MPYINIWPEEADDIIKKQGESRLSNYKNEYEKKELHVYKYKYEFEKRGLAHEEIQKIINEYIHTDTHDDKIPSYYSDFLIEMYDIYYILKRTVEINSIDDFQKNFFGVVNAHFLPVVLVGMRLGYLEFVSRIIRDPRTKNFLNSTIGYNKFTVDKLNQYFDAECQFKYRLQDLAKDLRFSYVSEKYINLAGIYLDKLNKEPELHFETADELGENYAIIISI